MYGPRRFPHRCVCSLGGAARRPVSPVPSLFSCLYHLEMCDVVDCTRKRCTSQYLFQVSECQAPPMLSFAASLFYASWQLHASRICLAPIYESLRNLRSSRDVSGAFYLFVCKYYIVAAKFTLSSLMSFLFKFSHLCI